MNWLRIFFLTRFFNSIVEKGITGADKLIQKIPGKGTRTFVGVVLVGLGLALQNFAAICPLFGEICAAIMPFAPQIAAVGTALLAIGGVYAPAGFVGKLLEYQRSASPAPAAAPKNFNEANRVSS